MDDKTSVAALVERARAGDSAAWESLYRRAYPRLLAYARRRLPAEDAARDAVNDTMARAVRNIGRYRGEGAGWDAWLSGIIRHVVLDAQRVLARSRSAESHDGLVTDTADDICRQPDEMVLRSVEAAVVRAAYGRLPPGDRDILELRVVMGLTSEQAAEVLGKRPGAVRMAQQRALQRLRALLELEGVLGHA